MLRSEAGGVHRFFVWFLGVAVASLVVIGAVRLVHGTQASAERLISGDLRPVTPDRPRHASLPCAASALIRWLRLSPFLARCVGRPFTMSIGSSAASLILPRRQGPLAPLASRCCFALWAKTPP